MKEIRKIKAEGGEKRKNIKNMTNKKYAKIE
jgi:hypothetical protein